MADLASNLDLISQSQGQKESTADDLFNAASPATAFARRASTSALLTWGYSGGVVLVAGVPTTKPNGTLALTASSTCYVEIDSSGTVSFNTSAFTSGRTPLYTVTTGATTVTDWVDHRTGAVGGGGGGSSYSADVGDGSSTSITVTHSLGTKDVLVQLYDKTTPFAQIEAEVDHTTTSAVTLRFNVAPTSAQYRVVVIA